MLGRDCARSASDRSDRQLGAECGAADGPAGHIEADVTMSAAVGNFNSNGILGVARTVEGPLSDASVKL